MAHAIVRTLCSHAHQWRLARQELQKQKDQDASGCKPKTIKAQKAFDSLVKTDRYVVMNKRTGWCATKDWLSRHVQLSESGYPSLKKKDSKCQMWVLTVRIVLDGSSLRDLKFQAGQGKNFRNVRCFDLPNGKWKFHLTSIASGYEHVFGKDGEQDWVPKPPKIQRY